MDSPPSKEHIKYLFANAYSDLLSDLRSVSSVRPENEKRDYDEISHAPVPEDEDSAPATYKTRRRSRKSGSEDVFGELKRSRSKRKSSKQKTDITANFNASFETKQNTRIQVAAEVHRDASQPSEESAKIQEPTTDEIFDSLRKSNENDISCSQDSDVFLKVTKKRKSYPGASVAKVNLLNNNKRLSFNLDTDPEFEVPAKKVNKSNVSPRKSFPVKNESPNSSPGWSRVKAAAKDLKNPFKPSLDISSSKNRSYKASNSVPVTPKAGNSSVLNVSTTSDSDLSDVRYFDSPDAEKRWQLMKHIVDATEQNEGSSTVSLPLPMDPASIDDLKKKKQEYVQKLCNPTSLALKRKREEDGPNYEELQNEKEIRELPVAISKKKMSLKSPLKIEKPSNSLQTEIEGKQLKSPRKLSKAKSQNKLNSSLNEKKSPDSIKNGNQNGPFQSKSKATDLFDSVKTTDLKSPLKACNVLLSNFAEQSELPIKAQNSSVLGRIKNVNQRESPLTVSDLTPPDCVQIRNKTEPSEPFLKALELSPSHENLREQLSSPREAKNSRNSFCTRNSAGSPVKNLEHVLGVIKPLSSTRIRNRMLGSPDVLTPEKNSESPLSSTEKSPNSNLSRNLSKTARPFDTPKKNIKSPLETEKSPNSLRRSNRYTGSPDIPMSEKNLIPLLTEKSSDFLPAKNRNKSPKMPMLENNLESPLIPDKSAEARNQNKIPEPPGVHMTGKNVELLTKAKGRGRPRKKVAALPNVPMPVKTQVLEANTDESVVCLGEFDFDQSQPFNDVASNKECGKRVSEKDGLLELSNCDVSEAPLSNRQNSGVGSIARRKLNNTRSTDLDNALTQILSPSGRSSTLEQPTYESTIPLSQNLCSRCKCAVSENNSSQDGVGSQRTDFVFTENKDNTQQIKPKISQADACVQTDDVLITEIGSSKEISIQTSPASQALETVSWKDKIDERCLRKRNEYILRTLGSIMERSLKLTPKDLENLDFEQENEPPRKRLKEITANNSQFVKFEDDTVRNENLPLQTWSLSANRSITDSPMLPPSDLKTPQNQVIVRKTTSEMKYSVVSAPSSSERKLLDEDKFLNRSTVCSRDVTICETEEPHPAEDSINKDVVPMETEDDFPSAIESLGNKIEVTGKYPEEIDANKLDIVRIRDKTNSSSSNDSLVLSSRKSVHRSLNFQNFFTKVNDETPKAENVDSQSHFSNEDVSNKHTNSSSKKVMFSFNTRAEESSLPHNQIEDLDYSEDLRKSLSVFPECMDTQKPEETQGGIVENSDDESVIQATPNKLIESSLTPDMLSSQPIKEESGFHLAPELLHTNSHKFSNNLDQCQADNSSAKQPNSIDSQVNEIPSSIVPTVDDYFPKRTEQKNTLYNILQNHVENHDASSLNRPLNPVLPVTRDDSYVSGHATRPQVLLAPSEPRKLYITTSGLTKQSLAGVQEFCKQFDCVYESKVTDRTTHLVIKADKNKALTTLKYILAVAMHRLIVTVDWVSACSRAKEIVHEDPYIPLSSTGRPGPLNSVLDKSNTTSPLFKDFIIHIIPPFSNFTASELIDILTWSGAKIAEDYADFSRDKSRIRLVLVNSESAEEQSSFYRELMLKYKVFILTHDWAIESVSNYKIEPFCNHNPLSAVYSFEMVSQFQIPNYIRDLASRYFESDDIDDTMSEISTTAAL